MARKDSTLITDLNEEGLRGSRCALKIISPKNRRFRWGSGYVQWFDYSQKKSKGQNRTETTNKTSCWCCLVGDKPLNNVSHYETSTSPFTFYRRRGLPKC